MSRDALLANLCRARDMIESERQQRGKMQLGIKRPKLLSPELEEADGHLRFVIEQQLPALKITEARKPKLSVQSHWLLRYLAQSGTVSVLESLHCHWSQQPDMKHARGLIRRGWAKEEMNGAIIAITPEGRQAAALVGPCPPVKQHLKDSCPSSLAGTRKPLSSRERAGGE
jgi:hypothetical protein